MTPSPQSVCKHCHAEIVREGIYWRSSDSGNRCCDIRVGDAIPRHHEPVAEPGDAPEWIMKPCPKELAAIMSSPADWLITRVDGNSRHTLYFSNEELEKLCQGYLQVIPLERLKDLRATGDAPKVEEIIDRLNAECVEYDSENGATLNKQKATTILRPYFPPASQTPEGKSKGKLRKEIRYLNDRIKVLEAEIFVARAPAHMRVQVITEVHANSMTSHANPTPNGGRAIPASTARTDANRGCVTCFHPVGYHHDEGDACTVLNCKCKAYAVPGSVPQAPNSPNKPPCPNCGCNHFRGENTLCNDGVPQAEPPKEEK